jgi:hypothetical protein
MENFLKTNNVNVVPGDIVSHAVSSDAPSVAGLFIAIVLQADIESTPTDSGHAISFLTGARQVKQEKNKQ